MKEIFTDFYNKVLGFFRQTEKKESAKDVACNRLRVVLMQDRTNLTPEHLERMRTELIELLSRYVEMDKEALELNFEQEGTQMALMLSIPVLRAKEESEIEKSIAEEEAAKQAAAETETDQSGETEGSDSELEPDLKDEISDEEKIEISEETPADEIEISEEIEIVEPDNETENIVE